MIKTMLARRYGVFFSSLARTFFSWQTAVVFALLAVLSLLLGGCAGEQPAQPAAVAVIVDKTANSQLANGAVPCLEEACADVVENGGHLSVVLASAKPELLCSQSVDAPGNTTRAALESRWQKDRAFAPVWQVDAQVPAAGEVDLLESLRLGAEALGSAPARECDSRTLYVASSGIGTAGLLDLTGNSPYGDVLAWDFGELVEHIASDTTSDAATAEALPDLTGVHVVWMGCGRLCDGAQCDVPAADIAQLKSLWTHVLQACGAQFDPQVDFVGCPVATEPADRSAYPAVTPVVFEQAFALAPVSFDENVIGFEPGSADYVDPTRAHEVLAPYAQAIAAGDGQVVVLGTTANDGNAAACRDLGRSRAQHVRDDLVALGVDPAQLTVCSAGYEGVGVRIDDADVDFYHDNYAPDGSFVEEIARTNRAVHLVPLPLADDLLFRFGE